MTQLYYTIAKQNSVGEWVIKQSFDTMKKARQKLREDRAAGLHPRIIVSDGTAGQLAEKLRELVMVGFD